MADFNLVFFSFDKNYAVQLLYFLCDSVYVGLSKAAKSLTYTYSWSAYLNWCRSILLVHLLWSTVVWNKFWRCGCFSNLILVVIRLIYSSDSFWVKTNLWLTWLVENFPYILDFVDLCHTNDFTSEANHLHGIANDLRCNDLLIEDTLWETRLHLMRQ